MAVELTFVIMVRDEVLAEEILEAMKEQYDVVAWDTEDV